MPLSILIYSTTNLIVFRHIAELISGRELARRLIEAEKQTRSGDSATLLNALLVAGAVECALADRDSSCAHQAAAITDFFSALLVGTAPCKHTNLQSLFAAVTAALPDELRISPPEGFSYYALHPADFADAIATTPPAGPVAVIGIRSIGTVLSAVATAALNRQGIPAARITVRPTGHPFDRRTQFSESQSLWLDGKNKQLEKQHSTFLIVDEGPGLSGSSFLSVAEALTRHEVSPDRITLLGSRESAPEQLCAADAANRWKRFRFLKAPSRICRRFSGSIALSGGAWRSLLLGSDREWPASWPEMERLKFLSHDQQHFLKFEGFGEIGEKVRERSKIIASSGFGPNAEYAGDGMTSYKFTVGKPLSAADLNSEIIDRIAAYCAFRASTFVATSRCADQLEEMATFNFSQEFDGKLSLPAGVLQPSRRLIQDGRMNPQEWIRTLNGEILKVDASTHGDDHFLPGPTNIAWDLAGAIVEWKMDRDAQQFLIAKYRAQTGDDPSIRLPAYVLAYSIFRMAFCKTALHGTQVASEKPRLQNAYHFYRSRTEIACAENPALLAST